MHPEKNRTMKEASMTFQRRWWETDLQTVLIPLYIVSKLCCINAYTYRPMLRGGSSALASSNAKEDARNTPSNHIVFVSGQHDATQGDDWVPSRDPPDRPVLLAFSVIGVLHAVGCTLGYSAYHILSSLSQSSKLTDTNLVRIAIDLKNQYIGCLLVLGLVGVSLFRQSTVDAFLRTLLGVDRELATIRTNLPRGLQSRSVSNTVWLRNVLLMLTLGVGVKAVLEVSNCLMYIRDSGSPFSSYCLVLCIVPQTLCVVSELQFVAYVLLLRDRFALLNRWLRQLQPHLTSGNGAAFRSLGLITATHDELTKANGLLNQSFGVQNTILLLNQFVTLVELGYNTCMMTVRFAEADIQQGDSTEDFAETVTWVSWFVLEIFVLCYFSHVTVAEAQHTANLLSLPTVYSLQQRNHFRTVSQEHMTFLNKKICITCGGLFSIDLTLLYAIIGATSTYLIILIQFDQSFNGD